MVFVIVVTVDFSFYFFDKRLEREISASSSQNHSSFQVFFLFFSHFAFCRGLFVCLGLDHSTVLSPVNMGGGSWNWPSLGCTVGQLVHELGSPNVETT